jgi:N-methylhydantoinase B
MPAEGRVLTEIDPITTEVVASRIREIAATMEHALYHSGYSPILRESKDGTAGLTDRNGRVVIVGGGLQYHTLPYERAVRSVLARYPREGLRPGESFIGNDPYLVGNPHVPDMVAVTPAFADGALIGFGVSIAHKADVGGLVPGSSGAGAREIFHDGILIPPVRYQTNAGIDEIVEAIVRSNSRTPDIVLGDIRGQVGSTRVGVERLAALCAEYGAATVTGVMDDIIARTGRRLRAEIAAWPDGSAEAEGWLDHDGVVLDRPLRIHARVTKRGDRLVLDFSGSAPQVQGPVNANASTIEACALLAVLAAIDPSIPVNSGLRDAVDFVLPEGLIVSPKHPATMNNYTPACHVAYNCVLAALGQINPVRAVAPAGLGGGAIAIGYRNSRTGKPTVQYELMTTGLGGTSRNDGAQIVMGMNHITPGTPIEVLETEYALRVRAYDLWTDSAGPGRHRGGFGYVREYELLDDVVLTVRSSNQQHAAPGLDGGGSPKLSRTTLNPGGPGERSIGILETCRLGAGDVIRFEKAGGSGLGPPFERPVEQVVADVRNGYVSCAAAGDVYGVVVDAESLEADLAATARRRGAV